MHAIVLAGGKGSRLLPHTRAQPKALMKLGRYSILEIILRRLRASGFDRVTLCIAHLGDMIRAEFGSGRRLGLSIDYCVDQGPRGAGQGPLGTAAPLLLVEDWDEPAVVLNCDILTTIDFAELYQRHEESSSLLTVAFHQRRLSTNVGVLQVADDRVQAVWEKPSFNWNISSGIQTASPLVKKYIPNDGPSDMPSLINTLIEHDEPVNGYGFTGEWHDIGTPARYEQARAEFLADPDRYLGPVSPNGHSHAADIELPLDGGNGTSAVDMSVLIEAEPVSPAIESRA